MSRVGASRSWTYFTRRAKEQTTALDPIHTSRLDAEERRAARRERARERALEAAKGESRKGPWIQLGLCALGAVGCFSLVLYDTEVFYEIPRTEMRGQVVELDRITHDEDTGYIELSVGGQRKTITLQMNPRGPVERGDTVRAVARDWLWIQSELVELEVLVGDKPGKRLDVGRYDITPFRIFMVVLGGVLAWCSLTAATSISHSQSPLKGP